MPVSPYYRHFPVTWRRLLRVHPTKHGFREGTNTVLPKVGVSSVSLTQASPFIAMTLVGSRGQQTGVAWPLGRSFTSGVLSPFCVTILEQHEKVLLTSYVKNNNYFLMQPSPLPGFLPANSMTTLFLVLPRTLCVQCYDYLHFH